MATALELHDAIATRLETVPGLRAYNAPVYGQNPPVAFPVLTSWSTMAMGRAGLIEARFDVVILTAETIRPQDGYRRLLEFLDWEGPKSVFRALWDGWDTTTQTFVGLADTSLSTAEPGAFRVLGVEEMDALQAYGGAVDVRVITKE